MNWLRIIQFALENEMRELSIVRFSKKRQQFLMLENDELIVLEGRI